jgi:preprotein translocase subunit SecD
MPKLIKLITIFSCLSFILGANYAQNKLKDGLYLVDQLEIDSMQSILSDTRRAVIHYNSAFIEGDPIDYAPISIWVTDFVPIDLSTPPTTKNQNDQKKMLMMSLTEEASDKLKEFSTKNLLKLVVIVVNDEALTVHKIKEPITSGMLQITRCSDNACEQLFTVLKKHIRN